MYSYSHRPDSAWLGEFELPQQALITGRAKYADADKIFVGQWEPAHYSDFLPTTELLIAMMRENVSDVIGDEAADVYDMLRPQHKQSLRDHLVNAIGEWEADLPEQMQFTGRRVSTVVGYEPLDEVRVKDFS